MSSELSPSASGPKTIATRGERLSSASRVAASAADAEDVDDVAWAAVALLSSASPSVSNVEDERKDVHVEVEVEEKVEMEACVDETVSAESREES